MIVSKKFLSYIHGQKPGPEDPQLFKNKWSNLIADWCFKYYHKYNRAPKANIESILEKWARKSKDKDTVSLVEKFLANLSDEYDAQRKKINPSQLADVAMEYFNKIQLSRIKEDIEASLDEGDLKQAEIELAKYKKFEITNDRFVNPYLDAEVHRKAAESRTKPLFTYPGALGEFFGNMLSRGNFLAFQGPEGSGKSFWLQEICHQACKGQLNVMFFGIGDMSLDQTLWRYQARIARKPYNKQTYYYPVGWKSKSPEGYIFPRRKKRKSKTNLTLKEFEKARKKFHEWILGTDRDMFKMLCEPEMGVSQIRTSILKLKDRDGWIPDVIVLDYADLLEAPSTKNDKLDQIDENWRRLRNLALEFNCLLVTATQVKRTGYTKLWQELGDVSDQKKKAAHVNGMIGINFRLPEEEKEVRRLNWVKLRETTPRRRVQVAGCFALANPCVISTPV